MLLHILIEIIWADRNRSRLQFHCSPNWIRVAKSFLVLWSYHERILMIMVDWADSIDSIVVLSSSRVEQWFLLDQQRKIMSKFDNKKNIRGKEIQPSLKKELKLLAEQKMTVFFFLFFLNLGRQSIIVAFDIHHHHHHHHSSKEARQYHNGILIDTKRTKNPSSINPEIDLKSINAKVGWKTVRYFLFLFFFDFFFHQSFSFSFLHLSSYLETHQYLFDSNRCNRWL